jgi:hypothetical protein
MGRRSGDGTGEDHVIVGVAHNSCEEREVGDDQRRLPYALELILHIGVGVRIALADTRSGQKHPCRFGQAIFCDRTGEASSFGVVDQCMAAPPGVRNALTKVASGGVSANRVHGCGRVM